MSLLILFPNQLFDIKFINKILNYSKGQSIILLWEHYYFFNKYKYHKMKLLFHRCTMKSYYNKLSRKYNDNVYYIDNNNPDHVKTIISITK